jgi:hypothetical protein
MKSIFDQMVVDVVAQFGETGRHYAVYEAMQQVVLEGLYRGGFFKVATFYGGTCLRIFHGLVKIAKEK